ncbi:DUF3180 domain-containing protein [Streptosporangium lutulentum]|uniref:DUF3180 domain-containing protein n=1 Tax=Streptosporangium lutulentum TaxID=1461250 RepID=A0ABT9QN59_9ACTN|nr:DUF3180 domain-containing protein [Streptosporangium lutulentum]MDP9848207.1 hypothetical protein [Streptosporangium lutulentum]
MRPTRPGVLAGLFVVFTILTWGLLKPFYADLPIVQWTSIPTVLLLAIGEFYSGWMTKARIERKPNTKPVEPLTVARLVGLAKASAYGGAIFAGIFAGFALYTANLLDQSVPRRDFFITGGSFLACVLLVVSALYLEYCCKVPKDSDEKDR